jgi:hypothetical protein
MTAPEALYGREDAEAQLKKKMRAPTVSGRAVPIGMHGPARAARERKGGDRLAPILKGLNFEDIGAGAPPLDFLLSGDIGHDAPRAPGDLGDAIGSEMRDQGVQRGGNRGKRAQILDQCVTSSDRLPAQHRITVGVGHRFGAHGAVVGTKDAHLADGKAFFK